MEGTSYTSTFYLGCTKEEWDQAVLINELAYYKKVATLRFVMAIIFGVLCAIMAISNAILG